MGGNAGRKPGRHDRHPRAPERRRTPARPGRPRDRRPRFVRARASRNLLRRGVPRERRLHLLPRPGRPRDEPLRHVRDDPGYLSVVDGVRRESRGGSRSPPTNCSTTRSAEWVPEGRMFGRGGSTASTARSNRRCRPRSARSSTGAGSPGRPTSSSSSVTRPSGTKRSRRWPVPPARRWRPHDRRTNATSGTFDQPSRHRRSPRSNRQALQALGTRRDNPTFR